MQNPYAADGTAEQRERLQDAAARESGGGGGVGGMMGGEGAAAGMWGTLRKSVGEAGEWARRMEEQAWSLAQGRGEK